MAEKIKNGDVVSLSSGGDAFTVYNCEGESCSVMWFDKTASEIKTSTNIPLVCLRLYKPPGRGTK